MVAVLCLLASVNDSFLVQLYSIAWGFNKNITAMFRFYGRVTHSK